MKLYPIALLLRVESIVKFNEISVFNDIWPIANKGQSRPPPGKRVFNKVTEEWCYPKIGAITKTVENSALLLQIFNQAIQSRVVSKTKMNDYPKPKKV